MNTVKKYFNFRTTLSVISSILCIIAFNLVFAKHLEVESISESILGQTVVFGDGNYSLSVFGLLGYILLLLLAISLFIYPIIMKRVDKKLRFIIGIVLASVIALAALFILLEGVGFKMANSLVIGDAASVSLKAAPIMSVVFALLAGAGVLLTSLLKRDSD